RDEGSIRPDTRFTATMLVIAFGSISGILLMGAVAIAPRMNGEFKLRASLALNLRLVERHLSWVGGMMLASLPVLTMGTTLARSVHHRLFNCGKTHSIKPSLTVLRRAIRVMAS